VHTVGEITAFEQRDVSCGRGPDRCTTFLAVVQYTVDGEPHRTRIEQDTVRGARAPVSESRRAVGDWVLVRYNRFEPGWTMSDSMEQAFWCPLTTAVFGLIALVGSFFEPRDRRRSPLELLD
jgi:hypothetical protein